MKVKNEKKRTIEETKAKNSLRASVFICGCIYSRLCFFSSLRLVFLLATFALSTFAQTISGTISDSQNAPISNAEIVLSNQNKVVAQTITDAEGKFSLDHNVEPNLRLKITAKGFAIYEKSLSETDLTAPLTIVLQPQNLREEVTVSVTRAESRLSETPASVVVLKRETIEQTAAQTVDDSLRQVAGFTLFRRSSSKTSNPTTQGANLRGISGSGASRAAVLFDGLSLNDAFGGWTYWTRVPKIAVEQAEVLRGGASQFYGDTALSGAVNLLSAKAQENQPIFRLETSAGLQKTFDGSIFTAYGKQGWFFDLALESFQTRGYIPAAKEERGAADSEANSRHNNGLLTLAKKFGETARLFARGNLFSERRDNGTNLTKNRTYFRQGAFGADFANNKIGWFQFRSFVEAQVYDQTFSAVSPDRNTETLSRIQRVPSEALGANLFWTNAFGKHAVASSFEFRKVRGTSDETGFANNRATSISSSGGRERTFSIFVQDFWRVTKKLNINFGARFDAWKNFDALQSTKTLLINETLIVNFPNRNESAFSPRVAALYQANENFSFYGAYSKSFRAPTLNELYRAFRVGNVLTQANENLRAERADTTEAGVNFIGFQNKISLRTNVFVTEVSNPVVSITLTTIPNLITRQRQNIGKTRVRGLEIDAEYLLRRDLRFSASYLLVDSRVAEFPANTNLIGKFLPQIPKQQLTFQTFYRPQKKLAFSLQGRLSDAQFEDDLNTLRLRPFFTLDAFASYRLRKKLEIFAAIENVFDNRYDIGLTPTRTVAAPRFMRVGLRFDLKNK
jgi:outer membrane receptor protein involved in Fe transport